MYQLATPYAYGHNGAIGRTNRTLEEKIRSLLFQAGFESRFWGLAAQAATYLFNRSPHAAIDYLTPYMKVYNKKPNFDYLKIFGSRAYVFNGAKEDKTAPRSKIHYLVGYHNTGYHTYEKSTGKTYSAATGLALL